MNIFKAEKLGVTFFLNVQTPSGSKALRIDAEQLLKLEQEPDTFKAALFNLSLSEYFLWLEQEGGVICSSKTSSGRQCKNMVAGGVQLDSKTWKERQGEYCVTHGGPQKFEIGS